MDDDGAIVERRQADPRSVELHAARDGHRDDVHEVLAFGVGQVEDLEQAARRIEIAEGELRDHDAEAGGRRVGPHVAEHVEGDGLLAKRVAALGEHGEPQLRGRVEVDDRVATLAVLRPVDRHRGDVIARLAGGEEAALAAAGRRELDDLCGAGAIRHGRHPDRPVPRHGAVHGGPDGRPGPELHLHAVDPHVRQQADVHVLADGTAGDAVGPQPALAVGQGLDREASRGVGANGGLTAVDVAVDGHLVAVCRDQAPSPGARHRRLPRGGDLAVPSRDVLGQDGRPVEDQLQVVHPGRPAADVEASVRSAGARDEDRRQVDPVVADRHQGVVEQAPVVRVDLDGLPDPAGRWRAEVQRPEVRHGEVARRRAEVLARSLVGIGGRREEVGEQRTGAAAGGDGDGDEERGAEEQGHHRTPRG
ncbi:MAG: hypothetical protein ACFCGT_05075 [Sandaracinaceae bacterium]